MNAVLSGKLQAVKVLLSKGADTSIGEKDGYTPMHGAGFQVTPGRRHQLLSFCLANHAAMIRVETSIYSCAGTCRDRARPRGTWTQPERPPRGRLHPIPEVGVLSASKSDECMHRYVRKP